MNHCKTPVAALRHAPPAPVPQDLFALPAPLLAPLLLGKILQVTGPDGAVRRARITETEAYFGEEDTACHAHHGKTARTAPLYEAGGICYVYLCYGIHSLMNVVSGPAGHPEAVLLRGVEGAPGPGRAAAHLHIDRSCNREPILPAGSRVALLSDGCLPLFRTSARVGIPYAAEEDRNRPWRFILIREEPMEDKIYTVSKIEGEYATLRDEEGEELFIALALLPANTDVGARLVCRDLSFYPA